MASSGQDDYETMDARLLGHHGDAGSLYRRPESEDHKNKVR
jgi:hypothetical protein